MVRLPRGVERGEKSKGQGPQDRPGLFSVTRASLDANNSVLFILFIFSYLLKIIKFDMYIISF